MLSFTILPALINGTGVFRNIQDVLSGLRHFKRNIAIRRWRPDVKIFQPCRIRRNGKFPESCFQRTDPRNITDNNISGRAAPGMTPVLIGFERIIPGLHGDRGAAVNHIVPGTFAARSDQIQSVISQTVFKTALQQELSCKHTACHTFALKQLKYFFIFIFSEIPQRTG